MDSKVSSVRTFFRFKFAQIRGRNFMARDPKRRGRKRPQHQAPNTRKMPNPKRPAAADACWSVSLGASLGCGAWDWERSSLNWVIAELALVQVNGPGGPGR